MRIHLIGVLLCSLAACDITIEPQVPYTELDATERSSFTSDGRLWVIGVRPNELTELRGSLVEVVKTSDGQHTTQTLVAGNLGGTVDGRIGGAPAGDPCVFSGMKAQGMRIYAGCVSLDQYRASLIEVDLAEGTVRAGYFDSCNAQPSSSPCEYTRLYPNGMSIDAAGRIYVSDMLAHLKLADDIPTISEEGTGTIIQIVVDRSDRTPGVLKLTHRVWLTADSATDGYSPNGIQIDGDTLYYTAGANINRVPIDPNGDAGALSVHYRGAELSYIDDFCIVDGRMVLARTLPPALVALDRPNESGLAPELLVHNVDLSLTPSSISHQTNNNPVFPIDALVVTSFFGGGIYTATVDH